MIDDRRSALSTTGDVRALETRRRLTGAFLQAADEQLADITVVQICKLAGVGRSTFYTHFATVEDLAVAAIGDLFEDVSPVQAARRAHQETSRVEITRLGLQQLIDNLWCRRGAVRYAMSLPSGPVIRQRIIAFHTHGARAVVLAERPGLTEAEVTLVSNFVAGAIIQLFLTWLEEPEVGQDQVIELILTLLPAWLTTSPASPG